MSDFVDGAKAARSAAFGVLRQFEVSEELFAAVASATFSVIRAASGTPTRRAETTGSVGEADGGPTVATSDGDAQPQSGVNRHG